jgi:hypothetical protein
MRKSIKDYLNDPRLAEVPEMTAAPNAIRELHAIRLRLQDEHGVLSSNYAEGSGDFPRNFFVFLVFLLTLLLNSTIYSSYDN